MIAEGKNMKTKLWIIVGLVAIAAVLMVAPVMANTSSVTVSGDQQTNASITITDASLNFGTFVMGTNTVDSSIKVYTNDENWSVSVVADNSTMHSDEGYYLASAMTITP